MRSVIASKSVHLSSYLARVALLSLPASPTRSFHNTTPLHNAGKSSDLPWVTGTPPSKEFWDNKANQKKYLDHIYTQLQYTNPEDWYKIKKSDFVGATGKSFLTHFGNSPADAIISIYGGKQRLYPWKFPSVPAEFWQEGTNQRRFLEWLGQTLGYTSMDHWYKAVADDFVKNGGRGLLACYDNSIQNTLEFVFPEHGWLAWKFQKLPAGYWDDVHNIKQFLNWIAADLKLASLDDWLSVDIETLKKYDVVRVLAKYGTLRKVLQKVYPEHSWQQKPKPKSKPLPPSPPSSSPSPFPFPDFPSSSAPTTKRTKDNNDPTPYSPASPLNELPNIDTEGGIERFVYSWSESKFLLESKWDCTKDPTNWWFFGNPGGIRVIWEGKPKKFYTQTGGVFSPPPAFAKKLPKNANLDGTLTCIDGKVHHCVSAHLRANFADWTGVTFNIFDMPTNNTTLLEDRMKQIEELNLEASENINLLKPDRIQNMTQLLEKAKQLSKLGTDSILLREPNSQYEKGRSASFQRALIFNLQPALVTSVVGPFIMRCSFPDGTEFAMSHSLPQPPQVGSVVMIKFNNINEEGMPRNATVTPWHETLDWNLLVGKKLSYYMMLGDMRCP